MEKLKQELKQLKIQIRVGIDQKQISQDWGILLLDNLEEAINYTRCCTELCDKEKQAYKKGWEDGWEDGAKVGADDVSSRMWRGISNMHYNE
tara:strand:+ start:47 stop:322 length:276 start_codon:yes stop_codon:yes gene_type:complete